MAQSGTTGIQGAAYLIPDKIHQVLFESAVETDIVADISMNVLPPEQIPGSTLKVDIEVDGSFTRTRSVAAENCQKTKSAQFRQHWTSRTRGDSASE